MKRIAAIVTEYRLNSHADVLLGKFLAGFSCDDGLHRPRVHVASLYLDQIPDNDMGIAMAREYSVPVYPDIASALRVGGDKVAVDGVLIIGEHGDYPLNQRGQKLYPRHRLFQEVVQTLGADGISIPVFNDKHFSWSWDEALWMYQAARALNLPLMAGSSLPTCWRKPFVEYALGAEIQAAVSIGYGGIESYGFHALETLQCMIERRTGGETGVERVRCLEGDAVWEWLDENPVHAQLAEAASESITEREAPWSEVARVTEEPTLFEINYRDGLVGAVLMLNGYCRSFAFAGLAAQGVRACEFVLQGGPPHGHFSYLGRNIEEMVLTGTPSYPAERTLLTTGILAAAMNSRFEGHVWQATPQLGICYDAPSSVPYRPSANAPSGATISGE